MNSKYLRVSDRQCGGGGHGPFGVGDKRSTCDTLESPDESPWRKVSCQVETIGSLTLMVTFYPQRPDT